MISLLASFSKILPSTRILFYLYPYLNFFKVYNKKNLLQEIINIHNFRLLQKGNIYNNILILLPHCLQNSTCGHRITGSLLDNCISCGGCIIQKFKDLKTNNIKIFIASGGSIARQIIKQNKADFIVAVACENDLLSGIKDIKSIPVALVLNEKPHGPCKDTTVDFDKIKKILDAVS